MEFSKAYEALKQGKQIKRSHWAGCWERSGENIVMHCKNGEDILFTETKDVFFTVDNMIADDWEVTDGGLPEVSIPTFTFGEAIRRMKQGHRVARKGWNGKGMWLGLVAGSNYVIQMPVGAEEDTAEGEVKGLLPWIGMKTADDKFVPWLASQTDVLAEDWVIV